MVTPETAAIRWACSNSYSAEKFDAWLAEHDREIQAQALRDAAGPERRQPPYLVGVPTEDGSESFPHGGNDDDYVSAAFDAGVRYGSWAERNNLRSRAAHLTATTEEPTK